MSAKSNVDHTPYLQLACPYVCYVLGFLWADGYLINTKNNPYRISLEIVEKDYIDIEKIMDKYGKWSRAYRNRPNRQPQHTFVVSNKNLYNFLIDNDYDKKSYIDPYKIISIIPEKLKHYWYRGYFDGDGCFYINKKHSLYQCHWSSSYEQDWSSVCSLLSNLKINHTVKQRLQGNNKYSLVRWTGRKQCVKFGDYIYQAYSNIGLKRKYEKYLSMMV